MKLFAVGLILLCHSGLAQQTLAPATGQNFAKQETAYMDSHYHLSAAQLQKVSVLNEKFYQQVAVVLSFEKDEARKRTEIAGLRNDRERDLKTILSSAQFDQFKADMEIARKRAQQKVEALNEQSRNPK